MIENEGSVEEASNMLGEQIAGYLDLTISDNPVFDHMAKLIALSKLSAMLCLKGGVSYEQFSGMLNNHFKMIAEKMEKIEREKNNE